MLCARIREVALSLKKGLSSSHEWHSGRRSRLSIIRTAARVRSRGRLRLTGLITRQPGDLGLPPAGAGFLPALTARNRIDQSRVSA